MGNFQTYISKCLGGSKNIFFLFFFRMPENRHEFSGMGMGILSKRQKTKGGGVVQQPALPNAS